MVVRHLVLSAFLGNYYKLVELSYDAIYSLDHGGGNISLIKKLIYRSVKKMHRRLSDAASERIRDMIITLELAPGQPLNEKDLMARLQVGRTPVRDALQRLAAEGLVTMVPRQGTFAAEANVNDLRSILELRLVLEPFSARLAAERAAPEHVADMRKLLRDDNLHTDEKHRYKLDLAFHRALSAAAQNARLAVILESLQVHSMRFFRYLGASRQPPEVIRQQHADILEAIAAKDAESAAQLMAMHVEAARDLLLSAVIGATEAMTRGRRSDAKE